MPITETLIIAAGVKGAKKIGTQYQPYVTFRGLSNVERVVQSAINANTVGNIVIWGDKKKLSFLLRGLINLKIKSIVVVEEKDNIIDSFIYAYLTSFNNKEINKLTNNFKSIDTLNWNSVVSLVRESHQKTSVNLILSDTPFVTRYEIDNFIKNKNKDADIILGRSNGERVEDLLKVNLTNFDASLAVKNYYKYIKSGKKIDLIVNSFFAGNPMIIDIELWSLLKSFHKNRTIIKGNKPNFVKIRNNIKACKKVFFNRTTKEKIKAIYFLSKSYYRIIRHKKTSNFSDISLIEKNILLLSGVKVSYMIDNSVGSVLDVDTEYEKIFFEENFEKIESYIDSFEG